MTSIYNTTACIPQRTLSNAAHSLCRLPSAVAELAYMVKVSLLWFHCALHTALHDNDSECASGKCFSSVAVVRAHAKRINIASLYHIARHWHLQHISHIKRMRLTIESRSFGCESSRQLVQCSTATAACILIEMRSCKCDSTAADPMESI
jgi:hypothetical protein